LLALLLYIKGEAQEKGTPCKKTTAFAKLDACITQ